jgi:hypothetical protein
MDICLALAVSSTLLLRVPGPLTLRWRHSVEQFVIEEDWLATPQGLTLTEVRTEGLGAGVDLPAGAQRLKRGWRFTPHLPAQPQVLLANSHHAPGYSLCRNGECRRLDELVDAKDRAIAMVPCRTSAE